MTPIPPQRVINALDAAKYKFTLNRKKEDEINEVLLILKKAMPISLEKITMYVEVSATYSGKITSVLHRYELLEEKWLPNGGVTAKVSIPVGLKSKLITDLNNITHGSVIVDVLKQ
jgi:ribosome maturation protein SDO1